MFFPPGKFKHRIDPLEELRFARTTLHKFFDKANIGKVIVKVSEEQA